MVLALALFSTFQAYKAHLTQHELERLLWVEFDAAMDSLGRMLRLADAADRLPTGPGTSLLAAYEQSLAVRRLAPIAEKLLQRRGIRAEPLAGYLLSLTGGVASLCAEARLSGIPDKIWLTELRNRLAQVHLAINKNTVERLSRHELQRAIDALFGTDATAAYFTAASAEPPACPYP